MTGSRIDDGARTREAGTCAGDRDPRVHERGTRETATREKATRGCTRRRGRGLSACCPEPAVRTRHVAGAYAAS